MADRPSRLSSVPEARVIDPVFDVWSVRSTIARAAVSREARKIVMER